MAIHLLLRALVDAAGAGNEQTPETRAGAGTGRVRAPQGDSMLGAGRPAGGLAEHRAQHICIERLETLGFKVVERTFDFSAWPGRFATPLAGVLLFIGALIIWLGTRAGQVDLPLTIGSAFLTIAAVGGVAAIDYGPTTFTRDRRTAVNLEATRGDPEIWLVAHIDSKSQTIPMLVRIASIVTCGVAWTVILTLWMTMFVIRIPAPVFAPPALVATIAAIPLILTFVGDRSAGALDNATGVATVLETVPRLDPTIPIGVLITSAEELGLAGARAWAHTWVQERRPGIVINVDSIDDRGAWRCMLSHDDALGTLRGAVDRARAESPERERHRIVIRGVLPGVLVDAVAFKDAGWPAVTISRGGFGSLVRIHTARDTVAHCSGAGISATADLASRIVGAIIARRTE